MTEPRRTEDVLVDIAEAIAAGRCLAARIRGQATGQHPARCAWCSWPEAALQAMAEEFAADWHYGRDGVPSRHALRVWTELPAAERERRIRDAAALPAEPAADVMAATPAAARDEEALSWL